jgi:hypothetical protein
MSYLHVFDANAAAIGLYSVSHGKVVLLGGGK